ncbi:MAG: glycerophosphodiester phosphodiesterase family protein [Devosiaceae bacterium]
MPNTPAWLTARPIAHRGLHDAASNLIENTIPAFEAAIARGFSIELDLQQTADGDVVVFHDHTLDRLTSEQGLVRARTRAQLEDIIVSDSGGTIPSLAQVLAEVDGRVPLIIELKSRFDGDMVIADAVAGAILAYSGPLALMSFDPALMARLRGHKTGHPLGIVSASMSYKHWGAIPLWRRFQLGAMLHGPGIWCDFVSYNQKDLPAVSPLLAKWIGRKALACWTVKDAATARRVGRFVDAITFEGFDPYEATD